MEGGIELEIIWMDDDLVEVRVQSSNGRFAAAADCYAGHDVFARIARTVRGFPSSCDDRREVEIGSLDSTFAGGGARLVLRCYDRAGHVVADVTVRADSHSGGSLGEANATASFSLAVEPAAVDNFVAALGSMSLVVGAGARLRQAT